MQGGADLAEQRAVGALAFALQHLAAAAGGISPSLDLRQIKFLSGVKFRILRTQLHAGARGYCQAPATGRRMAP